MFRLLKGLFVLLFALFTAISSFAQMQTFNALTGPQNPMELITEVFLGMGVEVTSLEFGGYEGAVGSFDNGMGAVGLESGIVMTTGYADSSILGSIGPANIGSDFATSIVSGSSDPDIESIIAPNGAFDIQVFKVVFIPQSDTIKFNYVWASEEYPEYTCSEFNDAFGFFLSGPGISGPYENDGVNIAMIPGSNMPVAINSINNGQVGQFGMAVNCQDPNGSLDFSEYYVDNFESQDQPVYDGFTTVLTAIAAVVPCEEYTMKLVIADAGDSSFDSAVFLERGSFSSDGLVGFDILYNYEDVVYETCEDQICIDFYLTQELDSFPFMVSLGVDTNSTATEGEDFESFPDMIVFENQQDTMQICIDIIDNPGMEEMEQIVINVEDMSMCDASMLTITIAQAPEVISEITGVQNACLGEEVSLSGSNSEGLGNLTYEWSTGDTSSTIDFTVFGEIPYSLTVTDECGNSAESSWLINVDTLIAVITGPEFACIGETVEISVISMGQVDSYEWSTGDTSSTIEVSLDDDFDFSVTVTGCEEIVLNWSISDEMCCSEPIAYYDLNECLASSGETAVYNEFTAQNLCPIECGSTSASFLFREPASSNRHSCTPGFVDKGMCISAFKGCEYEPGDAKSVIIEIAIDPNEGFGVRLDSFSFYELAPEMYDWINGDSGENDYPTFYGVRILEGDIVFYEESGFETSQNWTKEMFVFDSIMVSVEATIRIELLSYCPIGNGGNVAVWDLDEISVFASCYSLGMLEGELSGSVAMHSGEEISMATMILDRDNPNGLWLENTDEQGGFLFGAVPFEGEYSLVPKLEGEYMNGLSTYDIVLSQKHLLGRVPFDSPYDYVAGDMNGDDKVTALDLVLMRKLILGNEANENYQDVWRFIESSAELTIDAPFDFEGFLDLGNIDDHLSDQDFYAVKLGDISGDALIPGFDKIEDRSIEVIQLGYTKEDTGNSTDFHVFCKESGSLEGFQFCLVGEFDVTSDLIDINEQNVNRFNGHTYISWHGEARSMRPDMEILRLSSRNDLELKQVESILQSEWIDRKGLNRIEFSEESDIGLTADVFPNPFSDQISFNIKSSSSDVSIKLFDLLGRELYQKDLAKFGTSKNIEWNLSSAEIHSDSKMIIFEIRSGQELETGKLVRI